MSDVRTTSQLADTLHAIGRWYPGTADPPRTAVSTIRSAPGSKPPIPADVLSLRRETVDTLTSWALLVAEERDLRPDIKCARPRDVPPSIQGPACATCDHDSCQQARPYLACGCSRDPGRRLPDSGAHRLNAEDVPALISFLSTHAAWLAGHVAALDAIAELSRIAYALEEVIRQSRPASVRLGDCPEVDCGGQLTALVRRDDAMLPSTVRCNIERDHAWEPHDWPALGRRLEATA